jgi:hypothetical protein
MTSARKLHVSMFINCTTLSQLHVNRHGGLEKERQEADVMKNGNFLVLGDCVKIVMM